MYINAITYPEKNRDISLIKKKKNTNEFGYRVGNKQCEYKNHES